MWTSQLVSLQGPGVKVYKLQPIYIVVAMINQGILFYFVPIILNIKEKIKAHFASTGS